MISEIVASQDPAASSKTLSNTIKAFLTRPEPSLAFSPLEAGGDPSSTIVELAAGLLHTIKGPDVTPLVHQITNNVAMTQSANVTLALGASPIMATAPQEMEDLSKVIGALLVNFGTIADLSGMLLAGESFVYWNANHL